MLEISYLKYHRGNIRVVSVFFCPPVPSLHSSGGLAFFLLYGSQLSGWGLPGHVSVDALSGMSHLEYVQPEILYNRCKKIVK